MGYSDTLNRHNRASSTLPASAKAAKKLYQLFFKSGQAVEGVESNRRHRSPSPTGNRRSSSHKPISSESGAIFASQMRVILPEQKAIEKAKSPPVSPVKSPSYVSLDGGQSSPSSQGVGSTGSNTCLIAKKIYSVTSV